MILRSYIWYKIPLDPKSYRPAVLWYPNRTIHFHMTARSRGTKVFKKYHAPVVLHSIGTMVLRFHSPRYHGHMLSSYNLCMTHTTIARFCWFFTFNETYKHVRTFKKKTKETARSQRAIDEFYGWSLFFFYRGVL